LKNIACNFASQLTGLDLIKNTLNSVINASTELITVITNSVNALFRNDQVDLQNHLEDICGVFENINSSYMCQLFSKKFSKIL